MFSEALAKISFDSVWNSVMEQELDDEPCVKSE